MSHAGPDAEVAAGTGGSNGESRRSWAGSGLVTRIAFSAIAVAIGLAIVFAVLFLAIVSLHQRSLDARRSQQVIATANRLQTYVIDLETGARGFAITRQERISTLEVGPGAVPGGRHAPRSRRQPVQHRRALEIETSGLLQHFSVGLVDFCVGTHRWPHQSRRTRADGGRSRRFAVSSNASSTPKRH